MNAQQLATLLLRLFGVIVVFVAMLGFVFVSVFLLLYFVGAPDWFFRGLAPYAVQSLVASPAWLIGGIVILRCSRRIGAFIAEVSGLPEGRHGSTAS